MTRKLIAILLALSPSLALVAQDGPLRRADRLYGEFAFAEAIAQYERAFELGANDLEAARRLADSYRRVRDLASSEKWYALIAQGPGAAPEDLYNYADALRANAKYAKADSVMGCYARTRPEDGRGRRLSRTAEQWPMLLVDPFFEGDLTHLPFNSEAMDISPAWWNGKLVFASSRKQPTSVHRSHAWDGLPFLNLHVLNDSGAVLLKGTVNTRFHESDPTFGSGGTEMYFTRNSAARTAADLDNEGLGKLMIIRSVLENGTWSEGAPFAHNAEGHSTGHPALSADGRTLFFSSDRPGGFGGVDIWKCSRMPDGSWAVPVNLGPAVNTEGNEMFPRVHGEHALFFSSDGHAGLGGLDVFLAWVFGDTAMSPINLGAPVNSRSDDLSFALTPDGTRGYFCSDRKGGMGSTDLYAIALDRAFGDRIWINGRVISKETGEPLAHIPVRLLRPDRTIAAQTLTNASGRFEFTVAPQPLVVSAGIPGASDEELPLDEHLLIPAEDQLHLGDMALTTVIDLPIAIRVIDMRTEMPVPGVSISAWSETTSGRLSINGVTDANGVLRDTLNGVMLGEAFRMQAKLSHPARPPLSTTLQATVLSGREQHFDQAYDMGGEMLAALRMKREQLFDFIPQEEEGNTWSGRVIDRDDRQGLANVPVNLLDEHNNVLAHDLTDANGRYVLRSERVPATVDAHIPGGESATLSEIPAFGDEDLDDMELGGVIDLPVNAIVHDAFSNEPIPGVRITVRHRSSGRTMLEGTTNDQGILQGSFPNMRFGSEEQFDVTFEKEGYVALTAPVDISVLAFMEQALGGQGGFALIPDLNGLDIGRMMNLQPIFFDYNDAAIRNDAAGTLDLVARVLSLSPDLQIELRSHTDSRGGTAFNQFLSARRAENVKRYLVEAGIAADRLLAVGRGEREPVNACTDGVDCSEIEHQANRRTEFLVVGGGHTRMARTE